MWGVELYGLLRVRFACLRLSFVGLVTPNNLPRAMMTLPKAFYASI